jgi:hypothetical protein
MTLGVAQSAAKVSIVSEFGAALKGRKAATATRAQRATTKGSLIKECFADLVL